MSARRSTPLARETAEEMAEVIHLVVAGDEFTFSGDRELSVGRADSADVRLVSPYVSRRHGRLVPTPHGWVYEDLGSTHGTRFRGRRIDRLLLVGPVTLLLGEPGRGEEVHIRPEHPSTIFICYRREDSAGHAGRLRDGLVERFGDTQVFLDIDNIRFGEDFVEHVTRTIQACRVVLVVIGRSWLDSRDEQGHRRLDDPRDNVRLEITKALSEVSRATVIPVLIQGARMPREDSLPEDLRPLSRRNALVAPDERWRAEIDKLAERIEAIIRTPIAQPSPGDDQLTVG